ncbi:MAG: M3 family metallopeptidase [Gluconacetobacter diazotrophicus]|nr:M3 family metallopeptidase [Gluconacetobacter diazotrophicus]
MTATDNPFLAASTLPYGLPPFDRIRDEHYAPAFDAGMAEHRQEVAAVAGDPAPATFENTVAALERAGRTLRRVNRVFFNLTSAHTNPAIQAVERDIAPRLAAHWDEIHLDPALFARLETLFGQRDALALDPESRYLLDRYEKDFVRAGARLSDADKARLKAINAELATLQTAFNQGLLSEKNADGVVVTDRAQLAGLPEADIAAAAEAARAEGHAGAYVLRLLNTSGQPALALLQDRALRQRLLETSLARNSHGGEFDTRATLARIARLRAERAALLGYASHAAYQLEDQTAGSVEAVNRLLADLTTPAVANARREAADMQALVDAAEAPFPLAAWDWDFYAEQVRRARYDLDEAQIKPYFELERVLVDGVFYAATRLFGLTFQERFGLPVYHPDVRVFEIFDADGAPLALFLADFYARPSKRGGAWMNAYVSQSTLLGEMPVIGNHQNLTKPPAGEPTLLTTDEVRTAFHEFGHALHGLLSQVKYPRFSGTNVPRDFVEFPSQVNEMWAHWPEVIKNYARHHRTGEPIPDELLEKMRAAGTFNQGYKTTEYLAASLLDQAWHQLAPGQVPDGDVLAFEAAALAKAGVDFAPVPPRYRSPYFSHIFGGGYSAGYYSYIWSEVLDADGAEWIAAHGGLTRENGDRLRRTVLSRGGSADAMGLYRDFAGATPTVGPLLRRRGLEQT